MTAINAKSEALQPRDLCSEELDAVSGGFFLAPFSGLQSAAQQRRSRRRKGG